MSRVVILDGGSEEQLDLLLKVAREMGIQVSLPDEASSEFAVKEKTVYYTAEEARRISLEKIKHWADRK